MKIALAGAVAAFALAGATLATTTPAQAFLHFGVTINAGDVQYAYRDGYWDRWHRWHPWADPDDRRWWRMNHPGAYWDWRHDRDPDMGWRVAVGPGPGLTFAVGDVQYAYYDGWWDRWHRWHPWASDAERIWWRNHYADRYWDWRHDRDPDMGWRVAVGGPGVAVGIGVPGVSIGIGVPRFEVGVGDIAFAYRDGYWDRWHRWHVWHNDAEREWWYRNHRDRYWDWRHDRDRDMGWRHDWH